MTRKVYHGWIYVEREHGYKDYFYIQHNGPKGESIERGMGRGATGAAAAVNYFEKTLKLGSVSLETTPIGFRVFTEE